MDDFEGDVDVPIEQPRKKQKTELAFNSRMTLGRAVYEWKLTLLHAPDLTFSDFEYYLGPIKLKQINKGMTYGKRQAVEVSFWTECDLLRALEEFNHKLLGGHYITLKYPVEALEEMEKTESSWHSLPYYLVDDILAQLSVFCKGKLLKRVCKIWKKSIEKTERAYPVLLLGADPMGDAGSDLEKVGGEIKHIVAYPPYDYLDALPWIVSKNSHLERLTFYGSDSLETESICAVAAVPEVVLMNSFLQFAYFEEFRTRQLSLYVPLIKFRNLEPRANNDPMYPAVADGDDEEGSDLSDTDSEDEEDTLSKVMRTLDAADLWWPYPAEQTEWLKTSLDLLEGDQLDAIWAYISNTNNNEALVVGEGMPASHDGGWKGIRMWGNKLTKRDYAFIGGYIATLDSSLNIPPPPYQWKNTHFTGGQAGGFDECRRRGQENIRRRARSRNFLPN